jgi:hypothetical protein
MNNPNMNSTVVNLTPHNVNVINDDGTTTYPPSGTVARVTTQSVRVGLLGDGTPLFRTLYGEVEGLPEPTEGTVYLVSSLVRNRVPNRTDVFSPFQLVRDENGNTVGCRGLDVN